jgi:hypothetical protein
MTNVRLHIGDEVLSFDFSRFMMSEAIALEECFGLRLEDLKNGIQQAMPPLKVVAGIVWIAKVRQAAETAGCSFAHAAEALPAKDFDTDLMALRMEADDPAANPTSPGAKTRAPGTPTTRRTSAASKRKTV